MRAHPPLMKFINGKDNGNGPYFPSATRNRTSTDRAKASGALILPPSPPLSLSISAPFYGYLKLLKATQKGKKSKQRFEVTPRNCIRKLPRTNPLCWTFNGSDHRSTSLNVSEKGLWIEDYHAAITDNICSFQPQVQQLYKRLRLKESFCTRKEFNPHKTVVVNQHGHHFDTIIWS